MRIFWILLACYIFGTFPVCIYPLDHKEITSCRLPECISECSRDVCYLERNGVVCIYLIFLNSIIRHLIISKMEKDFLYENINVVNLKYLLKCSIV